MLFRYDLLAVAEEQGTNNPMKRIYKLAELEALPTLSQGQTDDLKVESENKRVWLSRMTIEDGQPYNNMVTVEILKSGYVPSTRKAYERTGETGKHLNPHWVTSYTYEAI